VKFHEISWSCRPTVKFGVRYRTWS
jgi:hypothetical protein